MTAKRIFKNLTLLVILAIMVWALWPEREKEATAPQTGTEPGSQAESVREVKYEIRMVPGPYMPGTVPMNIGDPLEALQRVADEFERLYPDTKIEFVNVPSLREWLVTQLSSGKAPDILSVNVEDAWQDVHKGWYVPLDEFLEKPNPFVEDGDPGSEQWWDIFKYQAITRGKAAPDGKMYCIVLDMVETGIFYNKDIFRKLSLEVPTDWEEFVDLMKQLGEADYVPILLSLTRMYDWGLDLIFDQLYYSLLPGIDLKKDPIREEYMQGYLDWDELSFLFGKGFFTRDDMRFREIWRILKEWRDYANKNLQSEVLTKLFVTQKAAMYWDGSWMVQKFSKSPDIDFEWGVFYPPPIPSSYSEFADGHDMCVIGGAAAQYEITSSAIRDTGDIATSERLRRCVAFLQFLTKPRNAELVVNEVSYFLPNVKGTSPVEALLPFDEMLKRRYTTTKWVYTFDNRFLDVLRCMLMLYLDGSITIDEHLEWMEKNVASATSTVARRKELQLTDFEKRWKELEPYRKDMKGLPDGAR